MLELIFNVKFNSIQIQSTLPKFACKEVIKIRTIKSRAFTVRSVTYVLQSRVQLTDINLTDIFQKIAKIGVTVNWTCKPILGPALFKPFFIERQTVLRQYSFISFFRLFYIRNKCAPLWAQIR